MLEREHAEQIARAHDALAAAQDRSYWLDRWGVDLNALMERPGAGQFRAARARRPRGLPAGQEGPRPAGRGSRPDARGARGARLMATVSVVIPVKDGAESLGRLLEALQAERPDEVLVIDSGIA